MKRLAAILLVLAVALPLCAQEKQEKKEPKPDKRKPGLYATLDTSMGKIVIQLYEKEAPKTVDNFVTLATGKKAWKDMRSGQMVAGKPFYDGIVFHRVIPNFMIQAGTYVADGNRASPVLPDEFGPGLKHDRPGRLSMANAGPNTGSSQFFITHVPTPHLDGKHAIFGQVVEGQDVVDAIAAVPRDRNDRPLTAVTINKVTIERVGTESVAKPK